MLYKRFLEDEVADLELAILMYGIDGLLLQFEIWLDNNNLLTSDET